MQDQIEQECSEPVDFDRLREITDGDDALMGMIIAEYLEQAERILSDMEQTIHDGRQEDTAKLAHKLVGSSATCGMSAVVAPLRALETLPSGRADEAPDLYRRITNRFTCLRQALEARN